MLMMTRRSGLVKKTDEEITTFEDLNKTMLDSHTINKKTLTLL